MARKPNKRTKKAGIVSGHDRKVPAPPRPALAKKLQASSRVLLKNIPTDEELWARLQALKRRGHQATAFVGASYLDHALELLLRSRFNLLGDDDDRRMFDGAQGGILGTLSAKIRIAYAMKLIHENPYKALLLINDIRNVFAHSLHTVTFNNKFVAEDCLKLAQISESLYFGASLTKRDKGIDIYASVIRALYSSIRNYDFLDGAPPPPPRVISIAV